MLSFRGMAYLEANNITHSFKDIRILDDFSMSADEGECVSLMGPSGSGKTTFLRILAGLLKPDEGTVFISGEDVTSRLPSERGMAMVFQSPALFPHTRIKDNIAYGMHKLGCSEEEIRTKVEATAAMLKISDQLNKYPGALSGGQLQRAGIARALVRSPKILLLDEPFSSLDRPLKYDLIDELRTIQKDLKMTMVYVTHDEEEARRLGARIVAVPQR